MTESIAHCRLSAGADGHRRRPALSAAATKDAIRRAQTVVAISGRHLGALRAIDVGPFQVTAPGSTDTSGGGVYDTTTREKDVTSVVNVTFAVG